MEMIEEFGDIEVDEEEEETEEEATERIRGDLMEKYEEEMVNLELVQVHFLFCVNYYIIYVYIPHHAHYTTSRAPHHTTPRAPHHTTPHHVHHTAPHHMLKKPIHIHRFTILKLQMHSVTCPDKFNI